MAIPVRLLLVEDSKDDAQLLLRAMKTGGYEVTHKRVDTAADLLSALGENNWDLVISDYSMPQFDALAALSIVKEKGADLPFIIVSGTVGEEVAVEAMKAGADDYLMKDKLARLVHAVKRELREKANRLKLKETEEQLWLSQKLEAVGQLAGGIAHDFNNLLTAITGYADLLLEKVRDDLAMKADLEEIMKAGDRAATLVRQLLAFSRKQVLQPKVIDLNSIVRDLEKILRRIIGEDVMLSTSLKSTLGRVKMDPGQIEQVIMNLVVNARDAMPRGGKVTIETSEVILDEAYALEHTSVKPGRYVMLAVSDNGCGIEKDVLPHIFEPFFTTKTIGKGTGLGLATVYGIVKQSGGNIWVYSEPGKGVTFKLYFPRVDQAVDSIEETKKITESPHGSETILLVEDDRVIRNLVHHVLQKYGYRVLEAGNGNEALAKCKQHQGPINLVLTDVVMPEMDGRSLVNELEKIYPKLKFLYMSGYTDDAIVNHGILDPGINFVQKPFTPAVLARKVRDVLDG